MISERTDTAFIGDIAGFAASRLTKQGIKVRFPGVVTGEDVTQHIEEYYG